MKKKLSDQELEHFNKALGAFTPSRDEVLARFGNFISNWARAENHRSADAFGVRVHRLGGSFIRVLADMVNLTAGLTPEPAGRKVANQSEENRVRYLFSRTAGNCVGRVGLEELGENRKRIECALEDLEGKPIAPFLLTTTRGDGEILASQAQVESGRCEFREEIIDDYFFVFESLDGTRSVAMALVKAQVE